METIKTGCRIRGFQITGVIFAASFFGFGLFMEYAACICAGVFGLALLGLLWKKEELPVFINSGSILVFVIALFYLLTAVWGVDAGMSLIGALRFFGVLVFALLSMGFSDLQREKLLLCIPISAGIMVALGIASLPFFRLRSFLWTAGRLGGFFQYPNTFALFCLFGFFVVSECSSKGAAAARFQKTAPLFLLLLGILLSGSRSVFFLAAGSMVFIAIVDQRQRKRMATLLGLAFSLGAGYAFFSGNMQNVGRFLTASFSSSTWIGRIIYAQDALNMIIKKPFGYGYLGAYFAGPKFQSAVYSVRFVHNDVLQLALDIGVLPCLLFLVVYGIHLFSKGHSLYTRGMLAAAGLHFLMDFDLAFISLWYVLILLLDLRGGRKIDICSAKIRRMTLGALLLSCCAALYAGAAMLPRYLGYPAISAAALPFYTEANREVLIQEKDPRRALDLAERMLRQNACIPEAYDVRAAAAYQNQQYREMLANKKQSLLFQRYDMDAYQRYLAILSQAVQKAAERKDEETVSLLLQGILWAWEILQKTEDGTNPLAFRTRDIPEFELGEEAKDYIRRVEWILEE